MSTGNKKLEEMTDQIIKGLQDEQGQWAGKLSAIEYFQKALEMTQKFSPNLLRKLAKDMPRRSGQFALSLSGAELKHWLDQCSCASRIDVVRIDVAATVAVEILERDGNVQAAEDSLVCL